MKKLFYLLPLLLALTAGCKKPADNPTPDPSKEPVETPSADPGDKSDDPSSDEKSEDPSMEPAPEIKVTVETGEVEDVTLYHALFHAKVTLENAPEGFQPVECFITYGFEPTADELISGGGLDELSAGTSDWVDIEAETEDLGADTKYYYVAWTKIDDVIYKGKVRNFTTKKYSDYAQAVDLGLSVKWCSVNIGAMEPEEWGVYFSWGETVAKTTFTWATYSLCTEFGGDPNYPGDMTKYEGVDAGDKTKKLSLSDDAAYKVLGRDWRMPTDTEAEELISQCSWEYDSDKISYIVTGPSGKSIVLPLAGCRDDLVGGLIFAAERGFYWTSEYQSGEGQEPSEANILYCSIVGSQTAKKEIITGRLDRFTGSPVRAVARE